MKENYKLELSSASLRNWNDGMVEDWNIGMLDWEDCKNAILTKGAIPLVTLKSSTTKGSHGLHQGPFKLQTMTAFNKKLLQGVQGDGFLEKSPPGRRRQRAGGDNARGH